MLADISKDHLSMPTGYTDGNTSDPESGDNDDNETDEKEEVIDEPVEFRLLHTHRCRPQSSTLRTIQLDPNKVKPGTELMFEPDLATLSEMGLAAPNTFIVADESSQATLVFDNPDPWQKIQLDEGTTLPNEKTIQ